MTPSPSTSSNTPLQSCNFQTNPPNSNQARTGQVALAALSITSPPSPQARPPLPIPGWVGSYGIPGNVLERRFFQPLPTHPNPFQTGSGNRISLEQGNGAFPPFPTGIFTRSTPFAPTKTPSSGTPSSGFIVSTFSPSLAYDPTDLRGQQGIAAAPEETTESAPMSEEEAIEKWIKCLEDGDDLDKVANTERTSKDKYEEGFICDISNNITRILDRLPARKAYEVSKESLVTTDNLRKALDKNPKAKEGFLTWIKTLLFYYDIEGDDLNDISPNELFDWDVMFDDTNSKNILIVSRMLNSCLVLGFKDLAVRIFKTLKIAPGNKEDKLKIWEKALEGALEDPEMQKIQSKSAVASIKNRVKALEQELLTQEIPFKRAGLLKSKNASSNVAAGNNSQIFGSDSEISEEYLRRREKDVMKRLEELRDLKGNLKRFEQELKQFGFISGKTQLDKKSAPYTLDYLCERPNLVKKHLDAILNSIPASSSKNPQIGSQGVEFNKSNLNSVQGTLKLNFNRIFDVIISQYGFETQNRQTVTNENFNPEFFKEEKNILGIARLLNAAVHFKSKEKALDFLKALKTYAPLEDQHVYLLESAVYSAFDNPWKNQEAWLQFFLGKGEDDLARSLDEILKRSPEYKERCHNVIQRIFPNQTASQSDTFAPVATKQFIEAFRAENSRGAKLRFNLKRCYLSMLDFYGFQEKEDGTVKKGENFDKRSAWLQINGKHNFLRISRILSSLSLLGLKKEAIHFHDALCSLYSEERCNNPEHPDFIPLKTREIWANSVSS